MSLLSFLWRSPLGGGGTRNFPEEQPLKPHGHPGHLGSWMILGTDFGCSSGDSLVLQMGNDPHGQSFTLGVPHPIPKPLQSPLFLRDWAESHEDSS